MQSFWPHHHQNLPWFERSAGIIFCFPFSASYQPTVISLTAPFFSSLYAGALAHRDACRLLSVRGQGCISTDPPCSHHHHIFPRPPRGCSGPLQKQSRRGKQWHWANDTAIYSNHSVKVHQFSLEICRPLGLAHPHVLTQIDYYSQTQTTKNLI